MSCAGNGYLSGNMLVPFPIEDGEFLDWGLPEAESNAVQTALQACFVDAGVFVDSTTSEESWPMLGGFSMPEEGASISFSLRVKDVFVPIMVSSSNISFPIVSGQADFGHYVLIMSSEGIRSFCELFRSMSASFPALPPPAQIPSSSSLGGGRGCWLKICAKCVAFRQWGLSSIRVFDGRVADGHTLESGPHFILKGNISVRSGNNILLEAPSGSSEGESGFSITAEPGAGLGRNPCVCKEVVGGNKELAGPDGHARIFNDTCYDLEPIGVKYMEYVDAFKRDLVTQDIKMHVKCTACCTCKMYGDVVDRLSEIAERIRKAKHRRGEDDAKAGVYDLLSDYENALARYKDRLSAPKLPDDVILIMSGMSMGTKLGTKIAPPDDRHSVSGQMERCTFTAVLSNCSFFEIIVKPRYLTGSDAIVEATAVWSDEEGNPLTLTDDSERGILENEYSIFPGRGLTITFISRRTNMVSSVITGGFEGSATFDLSWRSKEGEIFYLGRLSKGIEV